MSKMSHLSCLWFVLCKVPGDDEVSLLLLRPLFRKEHEQWRYKVLETSFFMVFARCMTLRGNWTRCCRFWRRNPSMLRPGRPLRSMNRKHEIGRASCRERV